MRSHRRPYQIITGHWARGHTFRRLFSPSVPQFNQGMRFDFHEAGVTSPWFESVFCRSQLRQFCLFFFFFLPPSRLGYEAAPLRRENDRGVWELEYWYAFEPDYLKQLPQLAQVAGVADPAGVHGDGQQLLQQPAAGALRRVSIRPTGLLPVPRRRHEHRAIQRKGLRPRFQHNIWGIQLLRLQPVSYSSRHR